MNSSTHCFSVQWTECDGQRWAVLFVSGPLLVDTVATSPATPEPSAVSGCSLDSANVTQSALFCASTQADMQTFTHSHQHKEISTGTHAFICAHCVYFSDTLTHQWKYLNKNIPDKSWWCTLGKTMSWSVQRWSPQTLLCWKQDWI
jgi:hypothetical protein